MNVEWEYINQKLLPFIGNEDEHVKICNDFDSKFNFDVINNIYNSFIKTNQIGLTMKTIHKITNEQYVHYTYANIYFLSKISKRDIDSDTWFELVLFNNDFFYKEIKGERLIIDNKYFIDITTDYKDHFKILDNFKDTYQVQILYSHHNYEIVINLKSTRILGTNIKLIFRYGNKTQDNQVTYQNI